MPDFLACQVTWAPVLTLLCFGFLICKMKVIIVLDKSALTIEISNLICVKHLVQCWHMVSTE